MVIETFLFRFCTAKVRCLTLNVFFFALILPMWKEQLFFLLCEVISSDRAACWCDSPSLMLMSPEELLRGFEAHFRSSKLCAATGLGSCLLRLCVVYIQQNNLGLDRIFTKFLTKFC